MKNPDIQITIKGAEGVGKTIIAKALGALLDNTGHYAFIRDEGFEDSLEVGCLDEAKRTLGLIPPVKVLIVTELTR